jgi:hypothetical protein
VTTISLSVFLAEADAGDIADLIEDHYEVPREILEKLAQRVAVDAAWMADGLLRENNPDAIWDFVSEIGDRDDWLGA